MRENTLNPCGSAPRGAWNTLPRSISQGGRFLSLALLALMLVAPRLARSADTTTNETGAAATPAVPASVRAEETNSQDILRAWLQLQEQLHATQLSIEQSRLAADKSAAENARVLGSRLDEIEKALATQRARELESLQSSNRVMIIAAAAFGGIGCVAMLLMVWFQWRAVHRRAEISASLPFGRAFASGAGLGTMPEVDTGLLGSGPAIESNKRLLGALEQLEKRILELEHTSTASLPHRSETQEAAAATARSEADGNGHPSSAPKAANGSSEETPANKAARLLAEGQSFLGAERPEEAIGCFDAVLAIDPRNGEALVKKGAALEKLRKLDEAIDHYNRAIAADASLTVAYLHKGGLFNRMERFSEALECYELALRTQEKQARRVTEATAPAS